MIASTSFEKLSEWVNDQQITQADIAKDKRPKLMAQLYPLVQAWVTEEFRPENSLTLYNDLASVPWHEDNWVKYCDLLAGDLLSLRSDELTSKVGLEKSEGKAIRQLADVRFCLMVIKGIGKPSNSSDSKYGLHKQYSERFISLVRPEICSQIIYFYSEDGVTNEQAGQISREVAECFRRFHINKRNFDYPIESHVTASGDWQFQGRKLFFLGCCEAQIGLAMKSKRDWLIPFVHGREIEEKSFTTDLKRNTAYMDLQKEIIGEIRRSDGKISQLTDEADDIISESITNMFNYLEDNDVADSARYTLPKSVKYDQNGEILRYYVSLEVRKVQRKANSEPYMDTLDERYTEDKDDSDEEPVIGRQDSSNSTDLAINYELFDNEVYEYDNLPDALKRIIEKHRFEILADYWIDNSTAQELVEKYKLKVKPNTIATWAKRFMDKAKDILPSLKSSEDEGHE